MERKIILITISLFLSANVFAKIRNYTLLEVIDGSSLIVHAKLLKSRGKFEYAVNSKRYCERYGKYKIIEVLKGAYNKKTLELDYKKINEKYQPFICRPVTAPNSKNSVILFLTPDKILFAGFQGKLYINKGTEEYVNAIKQIIRISTLQEDEIHEELSKAYYSDNRILKKFAKDIIVPSWSLISALYSPILVEVLGDKKDKLLGHKAAERLSMRYKAAKRLGTIQSKGTFKILSEYLYDDERLIRKACAEALGDLGDKRAIKVLESFIKNEQWENARYAAESSIRKLQK